MLSLGVMFDPRRSVADLPDVARQAEAAGAQELWLAEDCFLHGGLTAAATALAVTERLKVGLGLLPSLVRNPAICAMELGTLAQLHPERFVAVFGHGVDSWMRQIGARPLDRIRALAEVTGAVRDLLAGETLTRDDRHVHLDAVALEPAPAVPPRILIGTTGPKGLGVAAEHADGVNLPEGSGTDAVRWVAGALPEGSDVVVYVWVAADREVARTRLEAWQARGAYPRLAELAGVPDEGPITDEVIDRLVLRPQAGGLLDELEAAGATTVVLRPLGDDQDGLVTDALRAMRG